MPPLSLYARARTHSLHCVRDRRCGVHPAFPAPSRFRGGTISSKTRAHWRRGNAQSHSSFRGDAKASNPESRDSGFARARPGMTTERPAPSGCIAPRGREVMFSMKHRALTLNYIRLEDEDMADVAMTMRRLRSTLSLP